MTITALRPTTSTPCPTWHDGCETIRDRDGSSRLHHGTPATIKTRHDEVTVSYSRLDTPRGSGGHTAEIAVAGIPAYLDAAGQCEPGKSAPADFLERFNAGQRPHLEAGSDIR